ncbi:alpha/beta fold hydrolase BchO [Polaromonas sp. YR568]|uniref:alpha/beta fold hydrolase BchO n=1 Tax=Polaromonas sp. YR568 TaxID=1855301 RepID=UPI0031378552
MHERLDWNRDGHDWPHREASQFIEAAQLRWHVQRWARDVDAHGPAPLILLLHGTGSSTHSWRGLAPLLTRHADVLSLDLPGHGFTGMPADGAASPQLSLPGMAQAVSTLLGALQVSPTLVIGHSAGAAVAVRMALDGLIAPRGIVGLNAALLPLSGLAGQLFSPVAKLMAGTSFVPRYFASRATQPSVVKRLIDSTGSTLDAEGMALYGRLVASPGHAAGALGMMANWDLDTLAERLPRLQTPLDLVVGTNDRTVPPSQADRVLARLPSGLRSSLTMLPGLGHLAHEEQPQQVAELVRQRYFS